MATCHNINRLALEDLTANVKILKMIHEPRKLSIYEELVIIDKKPALNRQVDNFINPLDNSAHMGRWAEVIGNVKPLLSVGLGRLSSVFIRLCGRCCKRMTRYLILIAHYFSFA